MADDIEKKVTTENKNEPEKADAPVTDEEISALSDEVEKTFLDSDTSSEMKNETTVIDYEGASILEDDVSGPEDRINEEAAGESITPDNDPSSDVSKTEVLESPDQLIEETVTEISTSSDASEATKQSIDENHAETTTSVNVDSPDISNNEEDTISEEYKAKLDKDDIEEELKKSLDETIISSGSESDDVLGELGLLDDDFSDNTVVDKSSLDKDGLPENIFTEDKASLDSEGIPENIFLDDKAVLDSEGIPGTDSGDKAQLDIEGIPKSEKKQKGPVAPAVEKKHDETDETEKPDFIKNIITRLKQRSIVKIAVISLSILVSIVLCAVIIVLVVFPDTDNKTQEEIFADTEPLIEEEKVNEVPLIENHQMKTFVIPMVDPEIGTCFFKADFILTFNNVNAAELGNNSVKMRGAVYNHFLNKDPQIILKKLKKSKQIYELINTINLIFKKDAVKTISMVNYKVV